jgi:SOS response regulatory protein OraA/RecX
MEKKPGSQELEGARRWCALQERSTQDLETRLQKRGVALAERKHIVAVLVEEGFLDRARFAESYIRAHLVQKGWGPEKIGAALRAKGYGSEEVRAHCAGIPPETWNGVLERLVARRNWQDEGDRSRNIRWLLQRGFRWDDVARHLPPPGDTEG